MKSALIVLIRIACHGGPMRTTELCLAVLCLFVHPAGVSRADGQRPAQAGRRLPTDEGHTGAICALDLSADGGAIASGGTEGNVVLWDAKSGTIKHRFVHSKVRVTSVAFSPDGRTLAASFHPYSAKDVIVWDVDTGKELHHLATEGSPSRVAFSPDGKTLAVGMGVNLTYQFFDVTTWKEQRSFCWYLGFGLSPLRLPFRFSPDGRHFAALRAGQGTAVVVVLWAMSKQEPQVIGPETEHVIDLVFSPDGEYLAWADLNEVHIWDVGANRTLRTLKNTATPCLAFTPDGRYLAVGKQLHPLESKHPPLELPIEPSLFAFSRDGRVVAVPRDGSSLLVLDAKELAKSRQ
jgi:WD40 repeat protein